MSVFPAVLCGSFDPWFGAQGQSGGDSGGRGGLFRTTHAIPSDFYYTYLLAARLSHDLHRGSHGDHAAGGKCIRKRFYLVMLWINRDYLGGKIECGVGLYMNRGAPVGFDVNKGEKGKEKRKKKKKSNEEKKTSRARSISSDCTSAWQFGWLVDKGSCRYRRIQVVAQLFPGNIKRNWKKKTKKRREIMIS